MSLLQMSVSAGVMIAVITVIRALAISRLPKKTFLALWWIVLARLLVPFSWPSPFSIYSLVNSQAAMQIGGVPAVTVFPITSAANTLTTVTQANALSMWELIWEQARYYAPCIFLLLTSDATAGLEYPSQWKTLMPPAGFQNANASGLLQSGKQVAFRPLSPMGSSGP